MKKQTIWKEQLLNKTSRLQLPEGSEILSVQVQNDEPTIWFSCDAPADPEKLQERVFRLINTGEEFQAEKGKRLVYLGTFQLQQGAHIFHCFEEKLY